MEQVFSCVQFLSVSDALQDAYEDATRMSDEEETPGTEVHRRFLPLHIRKLNCYVPLP